MEKGKVVRSKDSMAVKKETIELSLFFYLLLDQLSLSFLPPSNVGLEGRAK